ncbi:Crp/Fnr family transcriptional regulator [Chelativorans sp.]|uniref:Crp/Fnr family transcriptional regulator n=1 Tax=Chelativorans sp. TaxID=2203393 RepID=UPI002811DF06|nr:Crp/Fnr family transcriptional regulator [Chelativorans sp.]
MAEHPLIKQLSVRSRISQEEQNALLQAVGGTREIAADEEFIREGSIPSESIFLLRGFAARYKNTPSGKRQIVALHIKGDFVDLHSFLLKKMDHGVFAMSACTIAWVPHDRLREITERFPHLTRQLWLSTLVDAAIHREWLVGLGRRSALQNLSHLLCELFVRLSTVDEVAGYTFRLPITQEELADARGMSIVHLNRSVQELRARGLITWRGDEVTINDWDRLADLAEFDPTYLNLDVKSR